MDLVRPEVVLVIGAVCAGAAVALVVLVVLVAGLVTWLRRPAPFDRDEFLVELGYQPVEAGGGSKTWTKPLYTSALNFDDRQGWKWTIRLPRYNTLSWRVEERNGGSALSGGTFATDNAELDGRFAMTAERAAQTLALATNRGVGTALLAAPFVSLTLRADELVLEDPRQRGLERLAKGAKPGSPAAVAAEREIHTSAAALVTAIFDALYSKQHAMTLFDEHR